MTMLNKALCEALDEARTGLDALRANQATLNALEKAGILLAECFKKGGRVFSCGNGGSMCDAMHFAEELSGRFRNDRAPLAATAISDASHLSCVSNDYGYAHVFARYIDAHARPGDVLLAISTSGKSENVLLAIQSAKKKGASVIGMTGKTDCPMASCCDLLLASPAGRYADRVQELHIKMIHIMIELVERQLFPENYPA
ncbi:MAG: SIS domain-containing protein [Alphaproteobacteria bacterium]|nr:SIS domain-containing protein [Alphaproteobacteria bacterium]